MRTATLFNFLVESSLIGGLLIVLLLALRPVIRRGAGSRAVWLLWALVALRLLVPLALPNPLMNWLRPTLSIDAGIRPMADQVRTRVDDAAKELSSAFSGRGAALGTLLWRVAGATGNGRLAFAGMIVYLAGAAVCASWMTVRNVRFFRWMRANDAGVVTDAPCAAPVRRVRGVRGSCVWGLLHPSVAVPEDASGDTLTLMLLREQAHLTSRDTVWCFVRDLCCAVHWFNPLVWLAACVSRLDCELACDERVAASLDHERREAYARTLIHAPDSRRAAPPIVVCATCMTMRCGPLAMRIRQVLHGKPAGAGAIAAVALAAAAAVMLMFGTAEESSLKNIPALPSEPFSIGALADEQAAEHGARAFLALPGVNGPEVASAPYVTCQEDGWQVEFLTEEGASVIVRLTRAGAVTGYYNGTVSLDRLRPLASPITDETGEGERWRAYLRDFLSLAAPEAMTRCDDVHIADSARLDGERFLHVHLTRRGAPLWHVILQVSPPLPPPRPPTGGRGFAPAPHQRGRCPLWTSPAGALSLHPAEGPFGPSGHPKLGNHTLCERRAKGAPHRRRQGNSHKLPRRRRGTPVGGTPAGLRAFRRAGGWRMVQALSNPVHHVALAPSLTMAASHPSIADAQAPSDGRRFLPKRSLWRPAKASTHRLCQ